MLRFTTDLDWKVLLGLNIINVKVVVSKYLSKMGSYKSRKHLIHTKFENIFQVRDILSKDDYIRIYKMEKQLIFEQIFG